MLRTVAAESSLDVGTKDIRQSIFSVCSRRRNHSYIHIYGAPRIAIQLLL